MNTQKTVLVTGCTQGGAGEALAREFRRRGHVVFATSTDGSRMRALREDEGVQTLALDVTSRESVRAAAARVGELSGGKLHLLVNNAAVFGMMPLADVDIDDARRVFDVNLFGALSVVQAFLPLLVAAGGQATVANVSSISAAMCPPWQGIYAASKAALTAMGGVMRIELAPLGVRVVTVVSGGVDTASIREGGARPGSVPADSFYRELAHSIESNEQARGVQGTAPVTYAAQVAEDLLSASPGPMIWRGAFSWLAWVFTWFGWVGMMDRGQMKRSRLDQITAGRDVLSGGGQLGSTLPAKDK
ncbi:hypothetical protein N3K66_000792 [Trichothecium roseum]|uniref:Uncharacterized protein n=1 Tax=Trichothecium roseum TaxID=47278 RepID=A0ACC0VES1_9HYPO|nr:hypothetical protein N3K66_000792 [Trichothecium roseum]